MSKLIICIFAINICAIHYFYKPDIKSNQLSTEETHYAIRVLRLQKGDIIEAFDGRGIMQKLRCLESQSGKMQVEILSEHTYKTDRDHRIHIAICPTKQKERTEWFIEKSVEIGIDKISFIQSKNSIRNKLREERINKTILSAARQSKNFILPEWRAMIDLETFVTESGNAIKYIAHLNSSGQKLPVDIVKSTSEYVVLIGPEGDFSESEVKIAHKYGFESLSLGQSRLRTETAGIFACTMLNLL